MLVRRIYVVANHVKTAKELEGDVVQLSLFENYEEKKQNEEKEEKLQKAVLNIQSSYGKNAILKGMNYQKEGTTRERNEQVGGHKA